MESAKISQLRGSAKGRKAIEQVKKDARELLSGRLLDQKADEVARTLSEGRWTHDYPPYAKDAKALGLNVSTAMPTEILDILSLYPQPVRTDVGGVEYLPVPRHRQAKDRAQ